MPRVSSARVTFAIASSIAETIAVTTSRSQAQLLPSGPVQAKPAPVVSGPMLPSAHTQPCALAAPS